MLRSPKTRYLPFFFWKEGSQFFPFFQFLFGKTTVHRGETGTFRAIGHKNLLLTTVYPFFQDLLRIFLVEIEFRQSQLSTFASSAYLSNINENMVTFSWTDIIWVIPVENYV